jgi:hypothetical protein
MLCCDARRARATHALHKEMLFLSIFFTITNAAATIDRRGVSPENMKRFDQAEKDGYFTCFDGSTKLLLSRVNDDYW